MRYWRLAFIFASIILLSGGVKSNTFLPPFKTQVDRRNKRVNHLYRDRRHQYLKNSKAISDHGRIVNNELSRYRSQSVIRVIVRFFSLSLTFAVPLLLSLLALVSSWFRHHVWYPLLVYCIGCSGAAFIKWGQWSATRPDMFPEELCRCLSKLHSNAPIHSASHTRKVLLNFFSVNDLNEIFDDFEWNPIASGSIAQVHRGVLNGIPVAVKVRHPLVAEKMSLDFRIMSRVAQVIDSIPSLRWLNLKPSMEQFSSTMGAQTRLDVEAVHLHLFNLNFKGSSDVSFPEPICWNEEVLVESFEDGELISKYVAQYVKKGSNFKLDDEVAYYVVSRGEEVYLQMLLQDKLMHADLHPGNILLCTDRKDDTSQRPVPRLILVDAGMVANLEANESDAFICLLQCLGTADGCGAARAILRFSAEQTCLPESAARFESDMVVLFHECCRGYYSGVHFGEVLRGALRLVRKHRVRVDANFATLIMNALCLDGLALTIRPEYNILDGARPLLETHRLINSIAVVGETLFRFLLPLAKAAKRRKDQAMKKYLRRVRENYQN